jgi:putative ABC transport system substrate-binding protein
VGDGLVSSLAHPGGNVTGLSFFMPDLVGKQLQLLRDIVPRLSRVAILRHPGSPGHRLMMEKAEVDARSLGIQLQVVDAEASAQFDSAFATMARGGAEGLVVPAHPLFAGERARLAELAARNRLPAMYGALEHIQAGGLIAYAPSLCESFRRGAYFVDRILKGTKPADLPVEQPTKFALVINLKTAKALGLTIPQSVLLRADEVIQ